MKRLGGFGIFLVVVATAFWWLMLEGKAPDSAANLFDVQSYRNMVADDVGQRPTALHIEMAGEDVAPGFAAETGNFGSNYAVTYSALQIVWSDKTIVIGGAADQSTTEGMRQSEEKGRFHPDAYDRIVQSMVSAEQVLITHEHLDHVMAIARHPLPDKLAPRLQLNTHQLAVLPNFTVSGKLPEAIANVTPTDFNEAQSIAPGVVVIPSAGHTPGNQSFYVQLEDGTEYLLIGDIVWTMSNIDSLKTRPRLLQYLMFDPDEQRDRILEQIRALHDLKIAEPNLVLVNSHDQHYLESLIDNNKLVSGFVELAAPNGEKQ
ncbi:MAG: hypothetical protein ABJN65_02555 [Parasphingorhabdus sp.]